ncbi:hypothetical protein PIB30_018483 [Stylosanthes scabra]|uniref:Uncharacterized protein n=1 Tax=Stylosanthes scabra TaxID=79078 RepID=A0ABU6WBJ7_9FABA|nr:hypothetical protein [Stylosanthes scabra]
MKGGGKRKASVSEPQNDSNDAEPSTASGPTKVLGANAVGHGDSSADSVVLAIPRLFRSHSQSLDPDSITGHHCIAPPLPGAEIIITSGQVGLNRADEKKKRKKRRKQDKRSEYSPTNKSNSCD